MIKITGYFEYNGSKSVFKRKRFRTIAKKLDHYREMLEAETGHQILFIKKSRKHES